MEASIFLAAFLGCLLAFTIVAVATWQISAFVVRKKLGSFAKTPAEGLEGAAYGDPQLRAELDSLAQRAAPGQSRRGYRRGPARRGVAVCTCGREQEVSEIPARAFLEGIGWTVLKSNGEFSCPFCVAKERAAS